MVLDKGVGRSNADDERHDRKQVNLPGIVTLAANFPAHCLVLPQEHQINTSGAREFPLCRCFTSMTLTQQHPRHRDGLIKLNPPPPEAR